MARGSNKPSDPPPPYRAQGPSARPAPPPQPRVHFQPPSCDHQRPHLHAHYTLHGRHSEVHPLLGYNHRQRRRPNPAHAVVIALLFIIATLLYLDHIRLYHGTPVLGRPDEGEDDRDHWRRMNLYWDTPVPAMHCARYGTRVYSARLWNVEAGYDWVKACEHTPVAINGRMIAHPDRCEDRGFFGGAVGYWNVTFGELMCEPGWGKTFDKGCAGKWSGHRLMESRLWGLREGEDWHNLCMTAPITINGITFEHPEYCVRTGNTMHAYWKVPDLKCIVHG